MFRKPYPNELVHGTTVRVNSPKDYAAMKRLNDTNNSDYNYFKGLLNKAIANADNAGQVSVLRSNPQALIKFAQQQRQTIHNKRSAFGDNYKRDLYRADIRGNKEEAARLGKNKATYEANAGKKLGLTDEEWAFIESHARSKGWTL